MSQRWTVLGVLALLVIAGCQNCRKAEEEAARATAAAEAEVAAVQDAEEAAAAAQREAEAQAAAERQAAEAAARAAEEAARRSYEVRKGDCLWYIAADRLADPRRWPEIYEANRSAILDPDLIYPDQVLTIPVGQ